MRYWCVSRRPRTSVTARKKSATTTSLGDYRAARHAAAILEGLLHEPPWLSSVGVDTSDGEVRIVVRLLYATPQARVCTPRKVNSIPVDIRLASGRAA
jgi:hypothetical protein